MSKRDWCNIPVNISWHNADYLIALQNWLKDNVDERDWDYEGHYGYRTYYFARKQDAMWFALRWS